jgi:hypothetical protein
MSPEEKEDVMAKFSEFGSDMSILVSTTVIEVNRSSFPDGCFGLVWFVLFYFVVLIILFYFIMYYFILFDFIIWFSFDLYFYHSFTTSPRHSSFLFFLVPTSLY